MIEIKQKAEKEKQIKLYQLRQHLHHLQEDIQLSISEYQHAYSIATDYYCYQMLPDWKELDSTAAWKLETHFENAELHISRFRPLTKVVHELHQIILILEKQIKKLKEEIRDAEEQES